MPGKLIDPLRNETSRSLPLQCRREQNDTPWQSSSTIPVLIIIIRRWISPSNLEITRNIPKSRKKESLRKTRIHCLICSNGEKLWRSHGAPRGAEFAWGVSHSHSYAVIGHQPSSTVFHLSLGSGIGEVAKRVDGEERGRHENKEENGNENERTYP